jgi:hypothetical protein
MFTLLFAAAAAAAAAANNNQYLSSWIDSDAAYSR